ncbi:MAG: protoporphyrinogen oxidase [Planctomycetota bacterium]|nr:MAG: protoporphyrinogen oxidase [Planctomycetota bacterium]
MSSPESTTRRIAVIGGGISGLAAAFRIAELAPQVELTLFEAGERLGGILGTIYDDGYLIEEAADNYLTDPPAVLRLAERLGIRESLIGTEPSQRRAYVLHNGCLHPVPAGFTLMAPSQLWPILTSPLLSLRGRLRLACERFVPRRGDDEPEESLAEFAIRRLGREAFERLVEPLVAGIYSADATKLSIAATLPRFVEMERRYGSLTRGAMAAARARRQSSVESGARYGIFVTPRDGAASLVETIASRLPPGCVQLNSRVEKLAHAGGAWELSCQAAGEARTASYDAVILATPAPTAAMLLEATDVAVAGLLGQIPHAGCAIVCLGLRRDQLARLPEGFGVVVPRTEGRPILAVSFASNKFPARAPDDALLVRVFIGGALNEAALEQSDAGLELVARTQLDELYGVRGEPQIARVVRWPGSMPQYHVGHGRLIEEIETRVARHEGLELANNALRGVGVPQCIAEGERAAEAVLAHLGQYDRDAAGAAASATSTAATEHEAVPEK